MHSIEKDQGDRAPVDRYLALVEEKGVKEERPWLCARPEHQETPRHAHVRMVARHIAEQLGEIALSRDTLWPRRTLNFSAWRACRGTIGRRVEQEAQHDPKPTPAGHTSSDRRDQDIGQGGDRQEEDS